MLAWDCRGSLGGCHPHGHAWIHGTHGSGGILGGLLFVILIVGLWDVVKNR